MSNLDTRKTGGAQTVSFATVRLESESLLPEQIVHLLPAATGDHSEVDVHVEQKGTALAAR